MEETRYAILIGMDNYNPDPLPYCVKDVEDLEEALISHCRFSPNNIHKVVDGKKPVKEQIDEAYSSITDTFVPDHDFLLFYFSGHGEYDEDEEKSKILFEDDTELSVEDILYRYFAKNKPKNLYLLIDACESGSNVYIKGKEDPEKEIRKLNYNSSQACLMFATERDKNATQGGDIQNSYFTYYFIEAIKNSKLYDQDGYLTIQAIDNYLKKKVVEKSEFLQIPVSEIRSSGYKVFSFDEKVIQSKSKMKQSKTKSKPTSAKDKPSSEKLTFEEGVLRKNRDKVQETYTAFIQDYINSLIDKLRSLGLEVVNSDSFDSFEYADQTRIQKKIIESSRNNGIEAIDGLFEISHREERRLKFGTLSILDSLYENPKPEYDYSINTYSNNIVIKGLSVKAKNISQVSGGIFVVFFQAKFGFAISILKYSYSWAGTSENGLDSLIVKVKPFLLNEDNESVISEFLEFNVGDFDRTINSWSEKRKEEIDTFKSNVEKSGKEN